MERGRKGALSRDARHARALDIGVETSDRWRYVRPTCLLCWVGRAARDHAIGIVARMWRKTADPVRNVRFDIRCTARRDVTKRISDAARISVCERE